MNNTIECCIFELFWVLNFSLNWQFLFLEQICSKRVFLVESRKSEHQHWILHIRISLVTKFRVKMTILIFWTKFIQKGCFRLKMEKVNTIIEFCIRGFVQVPISSKTGSFGFLDQICPKRIFLLENWKTNTTNEFYIPLLV